MHFTEKSGLDLISVRFSLYAVLRFRFYKVIMINICCICICLSQNIISYPFNVEDVFEYKKRWYNEFPQSDTVQIVTVFDSSDFVGTRYIKQIAYKINPIEPPGMHFSSNNFFIIDSLNNIFHHSTNFSRTNLVYKLNVTVGDNWVVTHGSGSSGDVASVLDIYTTFMFGDSVTAISIGYYSAFDTADTNTWMMLYRQVIADGFGLIYSGNSEGGSGDAYIIGATINNVTYGNITDLSISNEHYTISHLLSYNYPNPFNASTRIFFNLPSNSRVSIILYNCLGREVLSLIENDFYKAGVHNIIFESELLYSSGVYFYIIITEYDIVTRSMVIMK